MSTETRDEFGLIDAPLGTEMLRAMGRKAGRPAHIHMIIEAPGYDTVITSLVGR